MLRRREEDEGKTRKANDNTMVVDLHRADHVT